MARSGDLDLRPWLEGKALEVWDGSLEEERPILDRIDPEEDLPFSEGRHLKQVRATVTLLRKLPPVRLTQMQEDALIAQILHAPKSDSAAEVKLPIAPATK